jgi:hypothetical protein
MTGAWRVGVLCLALALTGCLDDGDARRVTSLELTRTLPRPVAAACRAIARDESLRVPPICPRLVPDLRIVTEEDNPSLIVPFPPTSYELTFNTAVSEPGHWVVGVGRPQAARQSVLSDTFNAVKGLPRLVRRLRDGSERVALYWYPPPGGAIHEGHVIAFVEKSDLSLWASIHGRRYGDAAVAMVLDMARSVSRASTCHHPWRCSAEDPYSWRVSSAYASEWTSAGSSSSS